MIDFEEITYLPMREHYGKKYTPKKWKPVLDFTIDFLTKLCKDTTIRFLYYRMIEESGLKIPLTTNTYDSYGGVITQARKDKSNPDYDILRNRIIDDTRGRSIGFYYDWMYPSENGLKWAIESELTKRRYVYPFDRWVELWFEDDGMYKMYGDIARKYRVSTECIGGNLIVNTVYGGCSRLREKNNPIILYIGDFNPSGNRRAYNIKTCFADLGLNVDVKKILITKSQIEQHNLKQDVKTPTMQERIKKAKRDPLIKWFTEKYGTDVYDVNAEAMNYDTVESIITKAIKDTVDVAKLKGLHEHETVEHSFEWVGDGYKITMDKLKGD